MSDGRKEDFKKYVSESGVVDSLNRVLAALYDEPQRPEDPMEYIKSYLGAPKGVKAEELEKENQELRNKIAEIDAQIALLTKSQKQ